jgi:hypothetical protein
MNEENEVVVPETTEEVTPEVTTTEEVVEESIEEVKARLAKAEEIANNYKIRAEKAEKISKSVKVETKVETKTESNDGLSVKDTLALFGAKVTEPEDVDEVVEWARFKKIQVTEALKSETIKARLKEKSEMRATAAATNTGPARRTTTKMTPDVLVSKAKAGELPESDEGMDALAEARLAQRKARK